jgi:hypothetical protein
MTMTTMMTTTMIWTLMLFYSACLHVQACAADASSQSDEKRGSATSMICIH